MKEKEMSGERMLKILEIFTFFGNHDCRSVLLRLTPHEDEIVLMHTLAWLEMDVHQTPIGWSMIGKYLDMVLNPFCGHSVGQDLDLLSSFLYEKLYSVWKIEQTPASVQVMWKFCQACVKNKVFSTSSWTSLKLCFHVLLQSRNDNSATSFSSAVSFSTCLKSTLLHNSISANTNSQELCLPVSCHNHQTTHEGVFPVHYVFIWPSKHSPVALDKF